MDTEYIVKQLLNGLAAGSIYALIAVGYNMVYGVLELINFAHGDIYMVGTFICLSLLIGKIPVIPAILLACIGGGLIGVLIERVAYRPIRNAPRVVPMISAVGAALVLRNVAQLVWGTETKPFPEVIPTNMIDMGIAEVNSLQLIILALALGLTGVFALIVRKTKLGKATRSVAQDIPAARLMGIEVNKIIQFVYFAGGFFGVAGGILFSMYYAVWIGMGFLGTMKAWIACVIGGIGSLQGAFVGGLLLGVAEAFISGFVSSAYRDAISYALVMIILVVRPMGIFGRQVAEKV
ncbi:MAG: branched-chain amino acid ABC transporter permease [Anaerolineales bacterium]|nr:branched-chain amino acid ABC transporter permease [Anaerolineales bacterium]